MKAERSPTHGGFPRPLKKTHIKEKLRFMKRCHAVVPCTGVKQSWLTEQELNRGGTRVRWCPTAEKKNPSRSKHMCYTAGVSSGVR